MGDQEILLERRGAAGLVTLNRPNALNALTLGMMRALRTALDEWASDDGVTSVVVTGAGDRAFCAGGDIRFLYEVGRAGRYDEALELFRTEYVLNTAVKQFPKSYVSLIDGVCMGGGIGISLHGTYRVAGERYMAAMPEVGIGLFPDVGATYALPRLPGATGMYLALTGERVRDGDAVSLGLATHAAARADFPAIVEGLASGEPADAVLDAHRRSPGDAKIVKHRAVIDRCFAEPTLPAILARLDEEGRAGSAFAAETAATIRSKSPTSLCIAFEQMRRGRDLPFVEAMRTEFRIVSRVIRGHEFYEGVRATLIDKDGAPRWDPPSIAEVSAADVAAYFAGLGPHELELQP